jgi:hypothetical protein
VERPALPDRARLTTSLMQHPNGDSFQIDIDFHEHRLAITTVSGSQRAMGLGSMPVPEFYRRLMALLDDLGLHTGIWPMPVEIPGALRFDRDDVHGSYERAQAHRFWPALVRMLPVFTEFRARFFGEASPIHLFWGGLDLASTRFSGRTAPPHPGGAPNCGPHVMAEAYSHEVSSCGYRVRRRRRGAVLQLRLPDTIGRGAPTAAAPVVY